MRKDKFSIRKENEALVLSTVIEWGKISRVEVTKKTNLNKASTSEIVNQKIEEGYLQESGKGLGSEVGGRKPIMLEFNYKIGVSLGIDVRPDGIIFKLSYLDGQIIDFGMKEIPINSTNVMNELIKIIESASIKSKDTIKGIIGITIGIHGVVDNNEIKFTPYYDIEKVQIYEELTKKFKIPLCLENEANLIAIGEMTYSSPGANLISISVHSGVGMGIISDSEIYKGEHGFSGEFGHTILYPNGKECPCGNKGCFEQYCSEKALVATYNEKNKTENLTEQDLIAAYYDNDSIAQEVVDTFCTGMSIGINNIISIFSPSDIYITSTITKAIPELLDRIRINLHSKFSIHTNINNSVLGNNGVLVGADTKNIMNFIGVKTLNLKTREER